MNDRCSRLRSIALVCGLVLLLSGCGVFTMQPFPGFLPYVEKEIDLRDTLPSERRDWVSGVVTATNNGDSLAAFMVRPNGPGDDVLVVVDAALNRRLVAVESTLSYFGQIFTRWDGSLQSGNLAYDPAADSSFIGVEAVNSGDSLVTDGSDYFTLGTNGTSLVVEQYDSVFAGPAGNDNPTLFSDGRNVERLRSETQLDGAGVAIAETVIHDETGSVFVWVCPVADIATLALPAPLFNVDGTSGDITPSDSDHILVELSGDIRSEFIRYTPDGILVSGDGDAFIRYDLANGEELDRLDLNDFDGDRYLVDFDPSGDHYYVLDLYNRTLYKVRTWW